MIRINNENTKAIADDKRNDFTRLESLDVPEHDRNTLKMHWRND